MKSYREAGVNIEKADQFVEFIKSIRSSAMGDGIGAFSSGFKINLNRYKNPIVLATTDGVGTKILIAEELGDYTTIGIDLVAMSVNDLLASGAEPYSFYDYIACGRLETKLLNQVIQSIVKGCEEGGLKLAGGETAELPDMYAEGDIDLAGFAVGIAEEDHILPHIDEIRTGDTVLGIPSSGIHSNGLSLARKVIPKSERNIRRMLLKPTRIYAKEIKAVLQTGAMLGAAHITGGGLKCNIERVIPKKLKLSLNRTWKIPEIFKLIKHYGKIEDEEMYKVFNMGIGMALICHSEDVPLMQKISDQNNFELLRIGSLKNG